MFEKNLYFDKTVGGQLGCCQVLNIDTNADANVKDEYKFK